MEENIKKLTDLELMSRDAMLETLKMAYLYTLDQLSFTDDRKPRLSNEGQRELGRRLGWYSCDASGEYFSASAKWPDSASLQTAIAGYMADRSDLVDYLGNIAYIYDRDYKKEETLRTEIARIDQVVANLLSKKQILLL